MIRTVFRLMVAGILLVPIGACRKPDPTAEAAAEVRAQLYLAKARYFADQHQIMEAVRESALAVSAAPDSVAALTLHGRLQRLAGIELDAGLDDATGLYQGARRSLERAIELAPDAAEPRIDLAQLHSDSGSTERAIEILTPVATDDHPRALLHLASMQLMLGAVDDAVDLFARGVALRPDDVAARLGYGTSLLRKDQLEAALGQIEQAVRLSPLASAGYLELGRVLVKLGRPNRAILAFARAEALDRQSDQAAYALWLQAKRVGLDGTAEAARRRYDRIQAARSRVAEMQARLHRSGAADTEALTELARSYLERGRPFRAETAARELIERADGPVARVLAAQAHFQFGRLDAALAEVDRALAMDSEFAEALELRGRLLAASGRPAEAQRAFARALELGRRTSQVFEGLATLAMVAGQTEVAVQIAERGLELLEDPHAPLVKLLALAALEQGQLQQAFRIMESYLVWDPSDPWALEQSAAIYDRLGRTEAASILRTQYDFVTRGPDR